jgi:hypothetical protein
MLGSGCRRRRLQICDADPLHRRAVLREPQDGRNKSHQPDVGLPLSQGSLGVRREPNTHNTRRGTIPVGPSNGVGTDDKSRWFHPSIAGYSAEADDLLATVGTIVS